MTGDRLLRIRRALVFVLIALYVVADSGRSSFRSRPPLSSR
jgi:hypothetical protein